MFENQIVKTMKVYVDDMLVKSKKANNHVKNLEEAFGVLWQYGMQLNPFKCVLGVNSGKILGFMVNERGIEANPKKIQALIDMGSLISVKEVQSLIGKVAALSRFISKAIDRCLPFFDAMQ